MSETGCKYYWFLHGCRPEPSKEIIGYNPEREAYRKSIGNWFETEADAIKARKKLQAWQRLKDEGFRFACWDGYVNIGMGDHFDCCGFFHAHGCWEKHHKNYEKFRNDLNLLFNQGGK